VNAPDDYNKHRLHKTWGEKHNLTHEQRRERAANTTHKHKNRLPGHFGKANWNAYQHYELYNMIMKADPRQMYERAEAWKTLSGDIESTTTQVQKVMEQAMTGWQGQAAVNAGTSTSRLMQWAGEASHTAGTVAANMSDYTDAVASAQRRMPDPAFTTAEQRFRDGYTVMTTGGPADAVFLKQLTTDGMVGHQEAHERKAEAVAVMEEYESHSKNVHDGMPHFADAEPTTKPQAAFTPSQPTGAGGGAGGSGGTGSTGFPPAGGGATGASPSGNGSTSAAGFVDPFGPGGGPNGTGPGGSTSFGGPGSLNGSGGADSFRTGSGFGAGFPGGAGGAGAGAAAEMGAGGLAARGPGGVVGGPGGGVLGGGAGARGGAGAFGGMPMGHGANGDEDGEHTNKYDEGLDLFDDLPPAYPPVFGA
jgi:uncharacterized protein YukE